MAVCCQNLPLGALSSSSALSMLVGALFKKFGLFLNTGVYTYLYKYLLSRGKIGLRIWFSMQYTRVLGRLLCSLFGIASVADIMCVIIISVCICLLYFSGSYIYVLSLLLYTKELLNCIEISFCLSFSHPFYILSSMLI